jgi:nitroreductase
MQNWRFIAVTDPDQKAALRAAAWNQAQVSEAALTLLICADLDAHNDAERYWTHAPDPVREMIVPMIAPFYADNPQLQRDEAMRSVGIAGQTIMLAAKAMGYDTCPMIGFDPNKVSEIIQLPERHLIGLMITIGKALKPANPRPGQLPYEEVVHRDHF